MRSKIALGITIIALVLVLSFVAVGYYFINQPHAQERLFITNVVFTGTNQVRGSLPPTIMNVVTVTVKNNGSMPVVIDKAWINDNPVSVNETISTNTLEQPIGLTYLWNKLAQHIKLSLNLTKERISHIQRLHRNYN